MSANEPLVPKRSPVVYSVSHLRLFLWTAKKKTLVHLAAKMCQVIGKERRGRWKKKESHCWFLMNSCRFCCCTKKGNKLSIFMFRWFKCYFSNLIHFFQFKRFVRFIWIFEKKRKSRDNRQSREWQRRGGHVGDIPPIVFTSALVVEKLHNLIAH